MDNGFELEVNVSPEEDTVWLSQEQMSQLFDVHKSRISRHISSIFETNELNPVSTVAENAIVQTEGNRQIRRIVHLYSLDMIIAVGYRVNSKRGTIFRQWANKVLKQYMLKGYAVEPSRVLVTQENYLNLVNVVNRIDSTQTELISREEKLESKYPELSNYVFACGQMYDATSFLSQIMEEAYSGIILIDNYVDRGTLDILSHKRQGVEVRIITSRDGNRITRKELDTFNTQYHNLSIETTDKVHDRYLIIDTAEMYHIGASLKDAGRKLFGMDLIHDPATIQFVLENSV